ncbi:MAG: SLC13/DASS family transporter [Flavobacteriales bacterium]|nr:SLC13/DASS family transporter [Flavobacteriales bacterium]MCB9448078.1 SLC13/DASS family transporter [Flavobacteriales bacterium]
MAFVAIWMAGWWITEAVNIFFTSLLPLVAFPLLGIMDMKETAPSYTNEIIFLFIGGFLIAFTLEKWNLHKRMALFLLLKIGATPSRLLLGFMTASYFLSMWIVNTATTMMLLPATMAVIGQIEDQTGKRDNKMATGFLLGLAYASSIGGTATVIGTAPNMAFMGFYNSNFPNLPAVNFTNWILFSLPVSLTFFALCFQVLRYRFLRHMKHTTISMDTCRMQYQQLGRMSYEEKSITAVFFATVLLWFFRQDIVLGSFTIPGWSGFLPVGGFIKDSTIAMIASCVLYLFPSRQRKGEGLLTWDQVQRIPFGIIFLFGGGFALANGITESGLSEWLTEHLKNLSGNWTPFQVVVTLCVFMTFFTELTSNTASTYLMLPILLSISAQFKASPLIFMVPVVLSASYAFMLPVATPPNTIVFGSERISMRDMTRTGLILNIIGVVLNVLAIFTLAKWLWQI